MSQNFETAIQNTYLVEQSVIGAVLIDNNVLNEIELQPNQFYSQEHQQIFGGMLELRALRMGIDLITLSEHIESKNNVNLFNQIAQYAKNTPSSANAKNYAQRVKEYWKSREGARIAHELSAIQNNFDAALIDDAIRRLMALGAENKVHNHHITTAIKNAIDDIEEAVQNGGNIKGLRTGIEALDKRIGGLVKTDLIVVGARPAMGKTALLLNMTTKDQESRVGICSSEQGNNQIGMRMLSIHGSVNGTNMRSGDLTQEQWTNLTCAAGKLRDRCIWIFDKPSMTIDDIERQARIWKHQNNINVLGVDYIQKIKHNGNISRLQQIEDICVRLKELAKELDLPVVALAQVHRRVEERADKMPMSSDIKDCGVIEQEADEIIMMTREEVYNPETSRKGVADLEITKNRHGPTGGFCAKWQAKYMQFGDMQRSGEAA